MRGTCLLATGLLMLLLGAGVSGCSRSGDDTAAAPPDATTAPTTAAASGSTQVPTGTPGTWPPDLQLPSGMTLIGTPVQGTDGMRATLSCSGRASAALTGLTAMLNDAGYKTKWVLHGNDTTRTAALEGSAGSKVVRAQINETAEGACQDVAVSVTD